MELTCPKCHGQMRQYERSGVTVDQCTECRGIFLDRGELEKLFEAEANWGRTQAAQQAKPGSQYAAPPPPGGQYAPPPPPPQTHGYPPAAPAYGQQPYGYHGHYKQRGYHGHYKRRKSFLHELFD
jgi:Zn-finger nucleic acid-binding protein